jgi:uncharacterized BrkB/YihY/UPF0761 family membrane protein
MRAPVILPIFGTALRAWWDDDAPRLGASLAYYILFAIAPVLLVATAIAGMVFGAEAVRGEIVEKKHRFLLGAAPSCHSNKLSCARARAFTGPWI